MVIPAYEEEKRLAQPLRAVAEYFRAQSYPVELLIVDDGSRDGTFSLVQELAPELGLPVRALRYAPNRGKGRALKVGFAHATGERILFTDADLATPIAETAALMQALDQGCDVAIGSRKLPDARIRVRQPWYRESMGKVFTWIVQRLLARVSDVTCGFKMFRADVGHDLFERARIDDWSFDAEILFLAEQKGLRIREIPVEWVDQAGSKVRLLRDSWSSLRGLIRIRRNHALGLYELADPVRDPIECWAPGEASAPQRRAEEALQP